MPYGRASWPWALIMGKAANSSPAHSAALGEASLRAIAATPSAAAAMANADGSLVANSPVPRTLATGHSIR